MDITVAAVTDPAAGTFALLPAQLEGPRAGEVLVRLAGTGICATDLHFASFLPARAVLGHEGAGVVEEVGPGVTAVAPGDHVALAFSSCGRCRPCRSAAPSYCARFDDLNFSGTRPDGSSAVRIDGEPVYAHFLGQSSFASHAVVGERSLVLLPEGTDLRTAGPFGCGFLTGAGTVLNVLRPGPGAALAVLGAGAVGLAAVLAAVAAGAERVVAVDVNPARRELAARLGATDVVDPLGGDLAGQLRELVPGGLDGAVDTTGRAEVVRDAVAALHTRGTCAVVGVGPSDTVNVDWRTLLNGRTVTGVISGSAVPQVLIPQLLALQRAGRFDVGPLLAPFAAADVAKAVDATRRGEVVKAVLTW